MHSALRRREQQFGGFRTSVMKDKEEELALFLEMKRREKERSDLLLNGSEDFDAPLGMICVHKFLDVFLVLRF